MTRARSLSLLANSNIFSVNQSNSRVGIGSTVPTVKLDVDGDMNVSGTLTYEDVTNVETTGIVTAAQLVVTGVGATFAGISTFLGDIQVGDKIIHTGDTNTAIRFPAADTFTVETSGSEAIRVDSSRRLLVGTTSGNYKTEIVDDSEANLAIRTYNDGAQNFAGIRLFKARGTQASPTVVSNDDTLNEINIYGYDGSNFRRAARIAAFVDGTPGSSDMPGRLTFSTTADGSSTPSERLRIDSSGNLNLVSSSSTLTDLNFTDNALNAYARVEGGKSGSGVGDLRFHTYSGGLSEQARIDSSGRLIIGDNSSEGSDRKLQVAATDSSAGIEVFRYVTSANSAPSLTLSRSNSGTLGTNTLIGDDFAVGYVQFKAANGSAYNTAAQIVAFVDGAPGVDDMPGRLTFQTTADGASSPTERARIDSSGRFYVGGTVNIAHPNMDDIIVGDATGNRGITVASATDGFGTLAFGDSTDGSGNDRYQGFVEYYHDDNSMRLGTVASERLRIDSSGRLLLNTTSARTNYFNSTSYGPLLNLEGTGNSNRVLSFIHNDNSGAPLLVLGATGGSSAGSNTIIGSSGKFGFLSFQGADGSQLVEGAKITGEVDGTPGADDMPGRLVFSTTADGAASPTERLRIDSSGRVLIGVNASYANASIDDLQIGNNSSSTQRGLTIGSTDECAIAFADAGDARAGSITYNHGQDAMIFKINGQNERLRMDSSGTIHFKNGLMIENGSTGTTARNGTQNVDLDAGMVRYYSTASTGNWKPNFRVSSSVSINSLMGTSDVISPTMIVAKGATSHHSDTIQVDGTDVTPEFLGGAPSDGGGSGTFDVYSYTIIKTGDAAFKAFASVSTYE